MDALIQQYKGLCADACHFDNKMWIIPTGTASVTLLALHALIETTDPFISLFAPIANLLVTVIFIHVFAKYRAFQTTNDLCLKELREKIPGLIDAPFMANLRNERLGYDVFWLVRFVSQYSGCVLWMCFMLLILTGDIAIPIWVLVR